MLNEISSISTSVLAISASQARPVETNAVSRSADITTNANTHGNRISQIDSSAQARLHVAGNLDVLNTALAGLSAVAQDIRTQSDQLQQLQSTLTSARDALEGFVKIYPPLPVDAPERVERLQAYAGYRKIVAQLTLTPIDPTWPPQTRINELPTSSTPDFTLTLASGDQVALPGKLNLPEQTVLPALPELGNYAEDAEVAEAVSELDTLISQVDEAGQALEGRFAEALGSIRLLGAAQPMTAGEQAIEAAQRLREQLADLTEGLISRQPVSTPLLSV